MPKFDGAVIREQGVSFALAVVKRSVVDSPSHRDQALSQFAQVFSGLPTVLMAQDAGGRARYYGREDLVGFLKDVPLEAIPWHTYTVS